MADSGKYKVIVKVSEASALPKACTAVKLRGVCDKKSRETSKIAAVNGAAQWETDNILAKNSLKTKEKELLEVTAVDGSDAVMGTCEIDVIDFVNKVPVGSKPKKFKVDKKLKNSEITLKVSISISRDGDEDDEDDKHKSKRVSEMKTDKDKRHSSRPSSEKKKGKRNSDDDSNDGAGDQTADSKFVHIVPASPVHRPKSALAAISVPRANTFTVSQLRKDSDKLTPDDAPPTRPRGNSDAERNLPSAEPSPRTAVRLASNSPSASPREDKSANRPRLVQPTVVSPFTSPPAARPAKYNTLASAAPTSHKSEGTDTSSATLSANAALKRPTTPGIGRPTTPGVTQATKYPSLGGKKSERVHRRQHSNEVSLEQIGDLKQRYAVERQEADEKFLTDTIIGSESAYDTFVAAYIIYQTLLNWSAFDVDRAIISRVLAAIETAIHNAEDSRTVLFSWLSNTLALRYMAHEDRKRNTNEEMENIFAQFEEDLFVSAALAFELAIKNLRKKLDPIMKKAFKDALLAPAGSERVLQDIKSGALATIFGILHDFVKLVQEHGVYPTVRTHFYKRIIHYITGSLIEALNDGGNSFSQGIQLKMVVTQFEEWASKKVSPEFAKIAIKGLAPAREAANVINFPTKKDLLQAPLRAEICPLLRPSLLADMLVGYKADMFDSEPIPPKLLEDLRKLDHSFMATDDTFEPQEQVPLPFEIDLTPLDLSKIQLPKLIIDRPGFAFLKQGALTFRATTPAEDEKW